MRHAEKEFVGNKKVQPLFQPPAISILSGYSQQNSVSPYLPLFKDWYSKVVLGTWNTDGRGDYFTRLLRDDEIASPSLSSLFREPVLSLTHPL